MDGCMEKKKQPALQFLPAACLKNHRSYVADIAFVPVVLRL
jgi:hypothetical protein